MKVLAFRHVPFEDVGHIRPVLENRGVSLECVDLYCAGTAAPEERPPSNSSNLANELQNLINNSD